MAFNRRDVPCQQAGCSSCDISVHFFLQTMMGPNCRCARGWEWLRTPAACPAGTPRRDQHPQQTPWIGLLDIDPYCQFSGGPSPSGAAGCTGLQGPEGGCRSTGCRAGSAGGTPEAGRPADPPLRLAQACLVCSGLPMLIPLQTSRPCTCGSASRPPRSCSAPRCHQPAPHSGLFL